MTRRVDERDSEIIRATRSALNELGASFEEDGTSFSWTMRDDAHATAIVLSVEAGVLCGRALLRAAPTADEVEEAEEANVRELNRQTFLIRSPENGHLVLMAKVWVADTAPETVKRHVYHLGEELLLEHKARQGEQLA